MLTYAYDAVGNVDSMTDYHGNVTSYSYDDLNRLHTMTAPGSKTWNFSYNALNQPTAEALPNGMATFYTYDTRNRLEKIDHKNQVLFGSTVESFDYTLDDDGNITRIDEHSGAYWVYGYDDRNRLTSATYTTDWGHDADYTYTYDDGDNMTAKSEPFDDTFNDGNYTGWTIGQGQGSWSAANYYLKNDYSTTVSSYIAHNIASPDYELRYSYYNEDTSNNSYFVRCAARNNATTRVDVRFYPNKAQIFEWNGSAWVTLDTDTSVTTAQDTWYDVVVKMDGGTVKVYRAEQGEQLAEVLSTTSASITSGGNMFFNVPAYGKVRFDNIKIIDGGTQSTWAMTSNNANELTQMANSAQGTTINFSYDAMGRTTEKEIGAHSAQYAWRYDSKLYSVDSDLPDEGDVTYDYGGDGLRRTRTTPTEFATYRIDGVGSIVSVEDVAHTPTALFCRIGNKVKAELAGGDPSLDSWTYNVQDIWDTSCFSFADDKSKVGEVSLTPTGAHFAMPSRTMTREFLGGIWDESIGGYVTAMAVFDPSTVRLLKSSGFRTANNGYPSPPYWRFGFSDPMAYITYSLTSQNLQKCCGGKAHFQQYVISIGSVLWNHLHPDQSRWHKDLTNPQGWYLHETSRVTNVTMTDEPNVPSGGYQNFRTEAWCCPPGKSCFYMDELWWHVVTKRRWLFWYTHTAGLGLL